MSRSSQTIKPQSRRCFRIQGQVQGVGFRPFVYRLACDLKLTGFVRNEPQGVVIEVQGNSEAIKQFTNALKSDRPVLTRYDSVTFTDKLPIESLDQTAFKIVASVQRHRGEHVINKTVTVDSAVCPDCLKEMRDPANRRYRYGLINCTHCGPRFSIINAVPYDRPNTSMAPFRMCPDCMQEYTNPADRRFHAQPTACHHCGPTVSLVDNHGKPIDGDPYSKAAAMLASGRILAIKGIGGFHLCVRADDPQAIARLRLLKQREHKPLALLCRNVTVAQSLVQLSDQALELLQSNTRPIVLAPSPRKFRKPLGEDFPKTTSLGTSKNDNIFKGTLPGGPGLSGLPGGGGG